VTISEQKCLLAAQALLNHLLKARPELYAALEYAVCEQKDDSMTEIFLHTILRYCQSSDDIDARMLFNAVKDAARQCEEYHGSK